MSLNYKAGRQLKVSYPHLLNHIFGLFNSEFLAFDTSLLREKPDFKLQSKKTRVSRSMQPLSYLDKAGFTKNQYFSFWLPLV